MSTMFHAIGKLTASNREALDEHTRRKISHALHHSSLVLATNSNDHNDWDNGEVRFRSYYSIEPNSIEVMHYLNRINRFINDRDTIALNFSGNLALTITGENPVLFRAHAEDGKIEFWQALIEWGNPKAFDKTALK